MWYRLNAFLARALAGRCGFDGLNKFIFAVYVALMAVNLIFRNRFVYLAIWLLFLLLLLRMFSRNLTARQRENNKFMQLVYKLRRQNRQRASRKADVTHIYKKCPHCKATVRLPRKKGHHRVDCPKCSREFKVHIFKS